MSANHMLHVRIDEETKVEAMRALDAMGLSISEAVRVFLKRVAADQAIPFEIRVPNAETKAAMAEAERRIKSRRVRFATGQELIDAIEQEGGEP